VQQLQVGHLKNLPNRQVFGGLKGLAGFQPPLLIESMNPNWMDLTVEAKKKPDCPYRVHKTRPRSLRSLAMTNRERFSRFLGHQRGARIIFIYN
jgi:hypothetical protein